jgi:outer membrane protein assembly factor BamB
MKDRFLILALVVLVMAAGTALAQDGPLIQYSQTGTGTLTPEDGEDIWVFEGAAGDVITATVQADPPFAEGGLDPELYLLNSAGEMLAYADDVNFEANNRDAVIQDFALPESGRYTLRVRQIGDSEGDYALSLIARGTPLPPGLSPLSTSACTDVSSLAMGGHVLEASSELTELPAENLIAGGVGGWASARDDEEPSIIFELGGTYMIDAVVLNPYSTSPGFDNNTIKDFRVLAGTGADLELEDFTEVFRGTAAFTNEPQYFPVWQAPANRVALVPVSNQGGDYFEATSFTVCARRALGPAGGEEIGGGGEQAPRYLPVWEVQRSTGEDLEAQFARLGRLVVRPDSGAVYVIDLGNGVRVIDGVDGAIISTLIYPEMGEPGGIAWGSDGALYVADWGKGQIVVLDPETGAVRRRWGAHGTDEGQFGPYAPQMVAYVRGEVWAVDVQADGSARVNVYDDGGIFARTLPLDFAPTAIMPWENGVLLGSDGGILTKLDPDGATAQAAPNALEGQKINALTAGPEDHIYAATSERIVKLAADGTLIDAIAGRIPDEAKVNFGAFAQVGGLGVGGDLIVWSDNGADWASLTALNLSGSPSGMQDGRPVFGPEALAQTFITEAGWQIGAPEGWHMPADEGSVVIIQDGDQPVVLRFTYGAASDLAVLVGTKPTATTSAAVLASLPQDEQTIFAQPDAFTVSGLPAVMRGFRRPGANGAFVVIGLGGGRFIVIEASADGGLWAAFEPTFAEMLASFVPPLR